MKSRNTEPELMLQEALKALEIDFETHQRDLPGTPDISIESVKIAVYVHGCYWHRHTDCVSNFVPKVKTLEWASKFNSIVQRDAQTQSAINEIGWTYFVAWECKIKQAPLAEALEIQTLMKRIESKRR
jgi:DNA mismatch endonuclease (patch repair protein)